MMKKLTKDQRTALKTVFDRKPLYRGETGALIWHQGDRPMTYREFRRTVIPELGGYGAALVPWCGMWLGIEKDGHTHS